DMGHPVRDPRRLQRGAGLDLHPPTPGRGRSRGRQRVSTSTVLVVEDEPSFVEALVAGLRREGFLPKVARTGREALALFDAHQPDLVLLDVMLPGMSGIDVCRELRRRSQVPIIMVSAKASEIDMVIGLEVGADD